MLGALLACVWTHVNTLCYTTVCLFFPPLYSLLLSSRISSTMQRKTSAQTDRQNDPLVSIPTSLPSSSSTTGGGGDQETKGSLDESKSSGKDKASSSSSSSAMSRNDFFRITCRDNGGGMAHDQIPRMLGIGTSRTDTHIHIAHTHTHAHVQMISN